METCRGSVLLFLFTVLSVGALVGQDKGIALVKPSDKSPENSNAKQLERYQRFMQKGRAFYAKSTYDSSLLYFQKALLMAAPLDSLALLVRTKLNIANLYEQLALYEESMTMTLSVSEMINEADYPAESVSLLVNMGNIRMDQGKTEEALKAYRQAYQIIQSYEVQLFRSVVLQNLGSVYARLGKTDSAKNYLRLSMAEHRTNRFALGLVQTMESLANIYLKEGEQTKVMALADSIERLAQAEQIGVGKLFAALLRTEALHGQGKHEPALMTGEAALSLCDSLNKNQDAFRLCELMQGIAEAKGEMKRALAFSDKAKDYQKKWLRAQSVSEELKAERRWRIKKLQEELEANKLKAVLLEKDKRLYNWVLSFVVLAFLSVLLASAMLYTRFKQHRANSKLREEHEKALRELAESKKAILNQEISSLVGKVLEKDKLIEESITEGKEKKHRLKKHHYEESKADELVALATENFPYFLENLLITFPDLTPKEKLMALCIKFNLSNEEIKNIFKLSHSNSASTLKNRLKHKLGFKDMKTLNSTIRNI